MNITGCLKRRSREEGFTLIELLVVILIIGILVAIAIPQYFKVAERSRIGDAMNFISSIKQSQERYLAKNGNYMTSVVTSISNLDIDFAGASPSFGMRNWTVTSVAASAIVGCVGWTMNLLRCTVNPCDSSNAKYGAYNLVYDSCSTTVPNPYGAGTTSAAVNADLL